MRGLFVQRKKIKPTRGPVNSKEIYLKDLKANIKQNQWLMTMVINSFRFENYQAQSAAKNYFY